MTQCAEGVLWLVTPPPGVDPNKSSSPECLLKPAALAKSVPLLSSSLCAPVCAASARCYVSPSPESRQSFPSPDTVPSLLGVTDSSSLRIRFPGCAAPIQTSLGLPHPPVPVSAYTSLAVAPPHIPSQPTLALVPPSSPVSVPTFPSAPHPGIELPVTPPTFSTVPSRARDEDWGQSIFQWGELGPTLCAFPQRRTHSASTVCYICAHPTFRLSPHSARSVARLFQPFRSLPCRVYSTLAFPIPMPHSFRSFRLSARVMSPACCLPTPRTTGLACHVISHPLCSVRSRRLPQRRSQMRRSPPFCNAQKPKSELNTTRFAPRSICSSCPAHKVAADRLALDPQQLAVHQRQLRLRAFTPAMPTPRGLRKPFNSSGAPTPTF